MLERSKLKRAGSLGSKNGPAKGFWLWLVAPDTVVLGGCGFTEDDKLLLRAVGVDFMLKVGETGD
jgi:hypothetical protein